MKYLLSMTKKLTKFRNFVIQIIEKTKFLDDWFYTDHLLEVEKQANWLCDLYPKADREAVLLSVWLHDIGRIEKGIDDGHEGYAFTRAKELLPDYGYIQDKVDLVATACQAHRVDNDLIPGSLEGKILATADALSHFYHFVYFRVFENYRKIKTFAESIEIVRKKLDRDYQNKLFFPEARTKVEQLYNSWMQILNNS